MAPRWTYSQHTDDQGTTTTTPLTPTQLAKSAAAVAQFLAYGKADRPQAPTADHPGLTTAEATTAAQAAIDQLLAKAAAAGTPITTATVTANTQVWQIAQKLGTPQWS